MPVKRIVLRFPSQIVDKPLIYYLVKDYELMINVIKANVNPNKEGFMVVELSGDTNKYEEGLEFLRNEGVTVDYLSEDIVRDDEKCTHCGACTGVCPSEALYVVRPSMEVAFDDSKCIVCGICLRTCPVKAIRLNLNGK